MIAITGAAGFIGSNLAHRLAGEGHELLLVDHPLTAPKVANWVGLDRFRFMDHERFLTALKSEIKELTAIFHLGACSATTEGDWGYLSRNNVGYTQTLWEWSARTGCPYFYASSAATYGDGLKGFDDQTPPTELTPLNLYGKSKNDFDIWALAEVAAGRPTPAKWAGMKFFNVYGPRETHKNRMASVVWQAFGQISRTNEMKLFRSSDPAFADGCQLRDFVFVGDCVDHMIWLWKNQAPGGVYNSGTGEPRTFLDLVKATFAAMGREPVIKFIDMPADLAGKYQNFTKAEMGKLRGAGYPAPATSLEAGVKKTVEWLAR